MSQPIRILLADDLRLLRMGFRLILNGETDLEVVGEAGDGAEAVHLTALLRPDIVLMDVRMPVLEGIAATKQIVQSGSAARIIILTTFDLDEYAFSGLQAGASGFVLKDTEPADLITAIRVVASGDSVIAPRMTRRLIDTYLRPVTTPAHPPPSPHEDPLLAGLTPREYEVLIALAEGMSNAEIAARFFLAETTIKSHVGQILAKLHLRDRVQAVVYAHKAGIAPTAP